jgi:hypothetical protein
MSKLNGTHVFFARKMFEKLATTFLKREERERERESKSRTLWLSEFIIENYILFMFLVFKNIFILKYIKIIFLDLIFYITTLKLLLIFFKKY